MWDVFNASYLVWVYQHSHLVGKFLCILGCSWWTHLVGKFLCILGCSWWIPPVCLLQDHMVPLSCKACGRHCLSSLLQYLPKIYMYNNLVKRAFTVYHRNVCVQICWGYTERLLSNGDINQTCFTNSLLCFLLLTWIAWEISCLGQVHGPELMPLLVSWWSLFIELCCDVLCFIEYLSLLSREVYGW